MAQGFKTKGLQGKTKSVASERKGKGVMKKGARAIPPKKKELVEAASKRKSSTVQHGNHFEELAASKVKGQLSAVMRDAGERGEAMPAEKRAKGR